MTPEQFEERALQCASRQELENLKANALTRSRNDLAEIADGHMRQRFPVRTRKGGGRTPTDVVFRERKEHFDSGKDGYVWLVSQFENHQPGLYAKYVELHKRRSTGGRHLAANPKELFPQGSSRADDASNYARVSAGWYVDINLNHTNKFALLLQLGYLAGLEFPIDYDFQVQEGTEELAERQKMVVRAREMLDELLGTE